MCLPPFAWTNVSSENKNACFAIWAHVGTKFLNLSHHFLSMDAWPSDATFFLWGQPVKIIRKYSSEKRSSPLSFIFVTCALASWSHFFGWWSWTCVSVPFCKDKCLFSKKHVFCNLGARWHKILEFVPSCHICGWLAWRCDFFPVVPTFEDQPQVFNQKGPAPWILFLTPAPRPLEVTFLVGEAEHVCLYPFARTNVFSAKNMYFAIWARWHKILEFVPLCPICGWLAWRCDFFLVGPTFEDHPQVFSQKRSSPLDFIFDTCASASWNHFFGWWSWTCVFDRCNFIMYVSLANKPHHRRTQQELQQELPANVTSTLRRIWSRSLARGRDQRRETEVLKGSPPPPVPPHLH